MQQQERQVAERVLRATTDTLQPWQHLRDYVLNGLSFRLWPVMPALFFACVVGMFALPKAIVSQQTSSSSNSKMDLSLSDSPFHPGVYGYLLSFGYVGLGLATRAARMAASGKIPIDKAVATLVAMIFNIIFATCISVFTPLGSRAEIYILVHIGCAIFIGISVGHFGLARDIPDVKSRIIFEFLAVPGFVMVFAGTFFINALVFALGSGVYGTSSIIQVVMIGVVGLLARIPIIALTQRFNLDLIVPDGGVQSYTYEHIRQRTALQTIEDLGMFEVVTVLAAMYIPSQKVFWSALALHVVTLVLVRCLLMCMMMIRKRRLRRHKIVPDAGDTKQQQSQDFVDTSGGAESSSKGGAGVTTSVGPFNTGSGSGTQNKQAGSLRAVLNTRMTSEADSGAVFVSTGGGSSQAESNSSVDPVNLQPPRNTSLSRRQQQFITQHHQQVSQYSVGSQQVSVDGPAFKTVDIDDAPSVISIPAITASDQHSQRDSFVGHAIGATSVTVDDDDPIMYPARAHRHKGHQAGHTNGVNGATVSQLTDSELGHVDIIDSDRGEDDNEDENKKMASSSLLMFRMDELEIGYALRQSWAMYGRCNAAFLAFVIMCAVRLIGSSSSSRLVNSNSGLSSSCGDVDITSFTNTDTPTIDRCSFNDMALRAAVWLGIHLMMDLLLMAIEANSFAVPYRLDKLNVRYTIWEALVATCGLLTGPSAVIAVIQGKIFSLS